ncbi:MAG TPA: 4-hydroxy-tetrahydrodipicolinate synthase [Candidatus Thermoplasmatota archaeon]
MAAAKLAGSMVAIVTPFRRDGSVDFKRLKELVGWHEGEGTDWVLACGTTGESATMDHDEHNKVISTVVGAASKARVMGGTAANDTRKGKAQVEEVSGLGVDAVLALSPYYNKPTQEGYFQHFSALARASSVPLVVYNVPGRTGGNIEAQTTLRLATVDGIGGVKEASGQMGQIMKILAGAPKSFAVISGDDALTFPMMACGARGVISVTANLLPKLVADVVHLAQRGRWDDARRLHERLLPVHDAMFIESNPIPVKEAMNLAGLRVGGYRLPLTAIAPANRERLKQVLVAAGVL